MSFRYAQVHRSISLLTRHASSRHVNKVIHRHPRIFLTVNNSHHHLHHSFMPWRRSFHATSHMDAVKPFLLADIGEGITECEVIQW